VKKVRPVARLAPRTRALGTFLMAVLSFATIGCQHVDRFDTSEGDAYCGSIVDGRFVRQGFERQLRVKLAIDTKQLFSRPGSLQSNDADTGPCAPQPLFDDAPLRVMPEVLADSLSTLEFADGQERNLISWVDSACQGTMLSVVSLKRNGDVELRLLRPGQDPEQTTTEVGKNEAGFGVFLLQRERDCGF
jgi:hypothetical protein